MGLKNKQFSKTPTFKATALNSPITEFALPLVSTRDGEYFASGTAIVVGPYLALTAKHVIEDYWERYQCTALDEGDVRGEFSIQAVQVIKKTEGLLWDITRVWLSQLTDVAFLRLSPRPSNKQHRWRCPKINLLQPPLGSRIVGFGYHRSRITLVETSDSVTVEWYDEPTTTVGEVIDIHPIKRDASRLNFPCFQTNARFDGGMSGGPVFNENGELCGLICSSMPPSEFDEQHLSYVTTLWPSMATSIDMDREGFEGGQKYPALELAQYGLITANGWESIFLVHDEAGKVTSVGLRRSND